MKSNTTIFLAVAGLVLASLACQTVMGGGNAPSVAPQGEVVFEDDFTSSSSSKWGTGTDSDRSIQYSNDALNVTIFTKNYFVWSGPPGDQEFGNSHIEVTVMNNNTDPTTAFGIICNQQVTTDSFYYFAITPGGQYAIARAAVGQKDVFLTNSDQWADSSAIKQNAPSYRLAADCGNGTLALFVDGQKIDSASDSTYANGGVAVFTWSGEDVASANVTFDDFRVSKLP